MPEHEAPQRFPGNNSRESAWRVVLSACSGESIQEEPASLLREPPDWSAALSLAEEHGVIAHLAKMLGSRAAAVPVEIFEKLQTLRHSQTLVSLSMTAELFRVVDAIQKAGIEVLAIKGPVLSTRAYGDPDFRQYGDLDFALRSRDIEEATRALAAQGYEPRVPLSAIQSGKVPGEYLFRKTSNNMLVELHTEQSLRYFPRALPIEEYFARQATVEIDSHRVPALAPEDEFVHLCVHGTKHTWERLSFVADAAAILRSDKLLDWRLTIDAAKRSKATRMLLLGATLAWEVLRARLPEELNGEIKKDQALHRIAREIEQRLRSAGRESSSIWKRAAYRVSTGGGGASGLAYFCRLALSTTEKDWSPRDSLPASWGDVMRRLTRLAKLYGRNSR